MKVFSKGWQQCVNVPGCLEIPRERTVGTIAGTSHSSKARFFIRIGPHSGQGVGFPLG